VAFRGYFALNGAELVNSSRTVAHLRQEVPTMDLGMFDGSDGVGMVEDPPGSGLYIPITVLTSPGLYSTEGLTEDPDPDNQGLYYDPDSVSTGPCAMVKYSNGLYEIPESSVPDGNFYTLPNGARRWGPGLYEVNGQCWNATAFCQPCSMSVATDDSWSGLKEWLDDYLYRPELAPWYSVRIPESGEFTGLWLMKVDGLDVTPVSRTITESVGAGGTAGVQHDTARTITFDALLLACSNAGLMHGLHWLTSQLRATNDSTDAVLSFFAAHPEKTAASAGELMRETRGVVLTKAPEITDQWSANGKQATLARVTWEMVALSPYIYQPRISFPVDWQTINYRPINWVHAPDCVTPDTCPDVPILFSTDCTPQTIDIVSTPPPVCGGCMPVCAQEEYIFTPPLLDRPILSLETAINLTFTNTGSAPLTVQTFWRVCGTDERCDDNQWPIQISGLPATASVTVDSILGRTTAAVDGKAYRPVGIVGTPTGAPWRPIVLDRSTCWEFVVVAPVGADFEVDMTLADRQP